MESVGTLATQAIIGVWVQAPGPGAFQWGSGGITPEKILRL